MSDAAARAAAASFDREYDASRALDHPDVPRAIAHGRDGDYPFLVTACVEGRSLADRRGEPFAVLAPLVIRLAHIVAVVHEKGWVHRDLKAGNVVVSGERRVLLTDFGLAARIGERQPPNGGSPFTRSPQQAAGLPAEPADDLYSFGALLYELLAGHPPHFPDRAALDVPHRRPPAMQSAHPLPERVERLVEQLLDPDPTARPRSMRAVAEVLEVAMNDPQPSGGSNSRSPVSLNWQVPAASSTMTTQPARVSWWPWVAGAAFVAAAFAVFVILPEHAPVTAPAPAPVQAVTAEPKVAAPETSAAAAAREAALRAQAGFKDRVAALEKRGAAAWSGPELASARAAALDGEQQLKSELYADALASYTSAIEHVAAVEARAPEALTKALADGAQALATARIGEATQAFRLALAIDPGNAAAQHGLKRAGAADRVQELIVEARRAATEKNWAASVDAYRHALSLDGETVEARQGLETAQRALNEEQYQTAMADALRGLNTRRFAAARAAIDRARELRPVAAEPKDLAARVNAAIAGTRIEDLRAEAGAHERAERWSDALAIYDSILERNATLLFAREGRDRVTPRVQLDARFNDFIARPERLGFPEVRDAARRAVAEAGAIGSPGTVLRAQVAKVEALLATAEKPVRVAIESDAATEVVIYRVGPLGAFTRREVELPPGTYTVLGTRTGFRDVRRELKVRPGEAPAALVVRCEDRI
jgi:tetratricopeptide (TPR) repeat protein